MKEKGGYFELELPFKEEYHKSCSKVNLARCAFEIIVKTKNYKTVYIPRFTCPSVRQTLIKADVPYIEYSINKDFLPVINDDIYSGDAILYTNYFGLFDENVKQVSGIYPNVIIDNSQSFFSKPLPNVPTFYSARKFFGVPDGAYLFLNEYDGNLVRGVSIDLMSSLIERIEYGAEYGYKKYLNKESFFEKLAPKQMSCLTERILQSIDYNSVKHIRNNNYLLYDEALKKFNRFMVNFSKEMTPMCYPLLLDKERSIQLKKRLLRNKVFIPTYWPHLLEDNADGQEYRLASSLVCLPLDQRLSSKDVLEIISLIS